MSFAILNKYPPIKPPRNSYYCENLIVNNYIVKLGKWVIVYDWFLPMFTTLCWLNNNFVGKTTLFVGRIIIFVD